MTSDLKSNLQQFTTLDENITKMQTQLKLMKQKKAVIGERIQEFLEENKEVLIKQYGEAKITAKRSGVEFVLVPKKKREQGLNKQWIETRVTDYCNSHRNGMVPSDLLEFIYNIEHRPVTLIEEMKVKKLKK